METRDPAAYPAPGPLPNYTISPSLEHELPHRRRDVRTVGVRRLVLLQGLVDVAPEEDPVAHLVDDLNGPVTVAVVDALPQIRPRVRRLAGDRGVSDARRVVDPVEVD